MGGLALLEVKYGQKKQYGARLKYVGYDSKKIYSDYSDVLTINTNKFSS